MPASSVGALNSWGLYLIASGLLVGMMSPQLLKMTSDSREGSDLRCADGVGAALDSLRPGMAISFSFGSWPWADPIHLGGLQISVVDGNGTMTLPSAWELPNETISPFVSYRAWLAGDLVRVAVAG